MANPDTWFFSHDGENRQGPFPWTQIQGYLKDGRLSPETLLWAPHLQDWIPAKQFNQVKQGKGTSRKVVMLIVGVLSALLIASVVKEVQRQNEARALALALSIQVKENAFLARGLKLINQSHMNTMVRGYGGFLGIPHASVGRAEDFPDMVLATVVWPGHRTIQCMVNPDNPPRFISPREIQATNLDPSLTNWNCKIASDGSILLNGFESQCRPSTGPAF